MNWLFSHRLAAIILVLAGTLALAACSTVKLGYSTLPTWAAWWLDGYVDFSDEQQPRLRDEIAALHSWHRQQELPRLVELLGRMEQLAGGEVEAQQACAIVGEVQARLKAVGRQAEPAAASLAAGLAPGQLQHIARKFRTNNERFRKEWVALSPEELLEKRSSQMLDRLESIYGRLDDAQRALLKQRMAATVWDPRRMLDRWQQRQQDLLRILARISQERLDAGAGAALLRGWIDRLERPADAASRAYQEALLQEGCATFAAVHRVTTPEQRLQAARRLRAWQRDLREMVLP